MKYCRQYAKQHTFNVVKTWKLMHVMLARGPTLLIGKTPAALYAVKGWDGAPQ